MGWGYRNGSATTNQGGGTRSTSVAVTALPKTNVCETSDSVPFKAVNAATVTKTQGLEQPQPRGFSCRNPPHVCTPVGRPVSTDNSPHVHAKPGSVLSQPGCFPKLNTIFCPKKAAWENREGYFPLSTQKSSLEHRSRQKSSDFIQLRLLRIKSVRTQYFPVEAVRQLDSASVYWQVPSSDAAFLQRMKQHKQEERRRNVQILTGRVRGTRKQTRI